MAMILQTEAPSNKERRISNAGSGPHRFDFATSNSFPLIFATTRLVLPVRAPGGRSR